MKLNHINIPVENVNEARVFFEAYFDFKCIDVKGDNTLVVLHGTDDFVLVLMSNAFNKNAVFAFPSAFHIGFLLDTKEEVMQQFNRLKGSNINIENDPGNMRGIFGFYFQAPGNILVEVSSLLK